MACKRIDCGANPEVYKLVAREISTWAAFGQEEDNIAAFSNDCSWDPDSHTINLYMDYYPGGDLETLINRCRYGNSRLFPHMALLVGLCVALGIQACHRRSIIHRDIKPANVLLTHSLAEMSDAYWASLKGNPDSEVRRLMQLAEAAGFPDDVAKSVAITDFGLGKFLTGSVNTWASYSFIGTPGYIAPETVGPSGKFSKMADIYSLGVLLHTLFSGKNPSSRTPTASSLDLPSEYPPGVRDIIKRCLAKNPESRPTAEQVCEALAEAGGAVMDSTKIQRAYENIQRLTGNPANSGSSSSSDSCLIM